MNESRRFLALWTLAIAASTAAFAFYLGLRVKSVELGYELGRTHARVARLREVERVLSLEAASYRNPERVELVARTLLGMGEPSPDRIVAAGELPVVSAEEETLTPAGAPPASGSPSASTSAVAAPPPPPEDDPMLGDEPEPPVSQIPRGAP